ncbi:Protein kinase-like domain containing protein [Amanita muscaria]
MVVDVSPQRRRISGFHRVRTAHELQPRLDLEPTGRRMASNGSYLSPLQQLTTSITDTYHICNPQFRYESTHNPRRVLTKPSKPVHNEGFDNEDYDYILYVNDWLGTEEGHKYLILDILGQGTFGQVVKCQNMKTHEVVAVKVVKNKPAYFNQSMMEVTILELLNKSCDPNDEHHILRLRDSFIHRNHLCLVFELLSSNLYELIKQNQFQGLSTQLVKVFMAQLLDAMTVLKDARLIHCDLKPENILLKSLQSPQIKIIDFGSACHERQTVYTYIQSRFYRSPEVLLGMNYTAAIDVWSLGCIAVELFLGLPLFPGTSEYNQLTRIIDMLGMPPLSMLNTGKQVHQFFDTHEVWNPQSNQNEKRYRLKSIEQYSREHNTNEQPGKQYFKANSLPELINSAPLPPSKNRTPHEIEKEMNNRAAFIDFCQGLLNLNPVTRWTPQQARMHPFITGEKFTKPFVPDGLTSSTPSSGPDPKRPYGGLVPSQPKGTRAYQDAATYNHHLAQHQAYTAQAQAASQAASVYRNPYITPQSQNPPAVTSSYAVTSDGASTYSSQQLNQHPQHAQFASNQAPSQHRIAQQQSSTGQPGMGNSVYPNHPSMASMNANTHLNPNVPSTSYFPTTRARANTINQMDTIPPALAPALARLQHMNQDVIGGRNALTPVLNRDDAMREWERRQTGKPIAAQPYPQLEYLQQQAEAAAASGFTNWASSSNRYPPPPSKLSHSFNIAVDNENARRDTVMSNVRNAARAENPNAIYGSGSMMTSPGQSFTGSSTAANNRYATTYPQQPQQPGSTPFDSLDRRTDIGNLYVPMQPDQYQSYAPTVPPASNARHVAAPAQGMAAASFYGAGIVPSGQTTNVQQQQRPLPIMDNAQQAVTGAAKDTRRGSGLDAWPR